MFDKEKKGVKPNTLRKFVSSDVRFDDIYSGIEKEITIVNTETKEEFTRKITDITVWKEWCIISWKHAVKSEVNGKEKKNGQKCL